MHVAHLDRDSQADFKAALERSLSTRQPGREGINNPFFERNTPRSKSLGRPGAKGTQIWVTGGTSDTAVEGLTLFYMGWESFVFSIIQAISRWTILGSSHIYWEGSV